MREIKKTLNLTLPILQPKFNMYLFLLSLLLKVVSPSNVYAETGSPTPTTQNDKVEDVKNIVKQLVKGTSPETISSQPKSFFGTITQIEETQISIDIQGQPKTLYLDDETTFVNSSKRQGKITDFKVGQTVIAMGYFNQDQSLDCRRLVYTDSKDIENNNQIVTGQIVDVSQSQTSPIFVLIPVQNKNSQYQIKTDSKTEFTDFNNKKLTQAKTVVTGNKITIVIQPDTKMANTFYATKIIDLQPEEE